MNPDRVAQLARGCTRVFAKPGRPAPQTEDRDDELGATVVGVPPLAPSDVGDQHRLVDAHFVSVRVDLAAAERAREELTVELLTHEEPERLGAGLSYVEMGRVLGMNDAALRLFALGEVLGFWDVVTPASLGFEGVEAEQLAARGLVMTTGFRP